MVKNSRNLDKLFETCAGLKMPYTEMMSFKAIFLGALSGDVPESIWDYALNETVKLFKEDKCQLTTKMVKKFPASQQS